MSCLDTSYTKNIEKIRNMYETNEGEGFSEEIGIFGGKYFANFQDLALLPSTREIFQGY